MPDTKVLQDILAIHDWRHPFELTNGDIVPMQRTELKGWNKWRAEVSLRALQRVITLQDCTVLDVACNDGYFSFQLGSAPRQRIGIDVRKHALRKANLMKQYYQVPTIEFVEADVRTFNFRELPECPFDLVLCYGLLYHLTDPYTFLKTLFPLTKQVLSLSTFLSWQQEPACTVTKEEVELEGSGLETISLRPSHQAVVRLLYSVGFDMVLRYVPRRHPFFGFYEWGHYFGVKLGDVSREHYSTEHHVQNRFSRFIPSDQLVLCRDTYDMKAIKVKGKPERFGNFFLERLKRKGKHFWARLQR